jgi:hypothetical protein
MEKSKEQLEIEINNSPIFSMREKNDEWNRECHMLQELVYKYYLLLHRREDGSSTNIQEYGVMITECTCACLQTFQADKGTTFSHYLRTSVKHAIDTANLKESYKGGFADINIAKYRRFKKAKNSLEGYHEKRLSHSEMIAQIAELTGISKADCEKYEIMEAQRENYIQIGDHCNEKISAIDAAKLNINNGESKIEKELLLREEVETAFELIEKTFLEEKEERKPYLSELLTLNYIEAIIKYDQVLKRAYSFIDKVMLSKCLKSYDLPKQKEIAEKYGKVESAAAKTLARFVEKTKATAF